MTESPHDDLGQRFDLDRDAPQYVTPRRLLIACLLLASIVLGALSAMLEVPALIFAAVLGISIVLLTARFPFFGLLLYLAIFLFRPGEVVPALAPLRLEFVLGSFLLVVSVVQQRLKTGKVMLPTDRLSLLLTLFLAAMLISVFASYEKTETIYACRDFGKTLVLYLLIVFLVDQPKKLYAFLVTYSLMTIYIAADSLWAYYSGNVMTVHGVDRLMGTTSAGGDPNSLATTMVVSIPLVYLTGRLSRSWLLKTAMIVACASMVMLVALTGSRGGALALLAVLAVATILLRQRALILAASLIVLPLVWFSMPAEYRARYEGALRAETLDEASTGRWEIWKAGLNMLASRPITGVGAGAFSWAHGSGSFGPRSYLQAHNVFIDIAATTGIIGLSVWLLFLGTMIQRLRWLRRSSALLLESRVSIMAQAFMLSLVALLISGFFAHNTYRYHWYLIAALTVVVIRVTQQNAMPQVPVGARHPDSTPSMTDSVDRPVLRAEG